MNAVTENTSLKIADSQSADLPVVATSSAALILDTQSMDSMMRLADIMATGRVTLPQQYRNSPGDCLAVIMQSIQWKMNPFAVAQKTHFINGNIGYEAQLVHAAITASGVISRDDFDYEFFGPWEKVIGKFDIRKNEKGEYRVPGWKLEDEDGCGVRVTAALRSTGTIKTMELLLAQARTRNSTQWADDPKQQLGYLAVKKWARRFAPGVILGVYTPDELEESPAPVRDITPTGNVPAPAEASPALLEEARTAANQGVTAYQKFWSETGAPNRKALAGYHEQLKATATSADKNRTVEMPSTTSQAVPSGMEELLANLEAAAIGGVEDFNAAWGSLSAATQEKLAAQYAGLVAQAEKAGGAK